MKAIKLIEDMIEVSQCRSSAKIRYEVLSKYHTALNYEISKYGIGTINVSTYGAACGTDYYNAYQYDLIEKITKLQKDLEKLPLNLSIAND